MVFCLGPHEEYCCFVLELWIQDLNFSVDTKKLKFLANFDVFLCKGKRNGYVEGRGGRENKVN